MRIRELLSRGMIHPPLPHGHPHTNTVPIADSTERTIVTHSIERASICRMRSRETQSICAVAVVGGRRRERE